MDLPERKRTRLKDYDYSQVGYYFITICTHNKENILGNIPDEDVGISTKILLSEIGMISEEEILKIESYYSNVKLNKYIIMPNHIHMIISITERINPFPTIKKYVISNIVGKFKAAVTRKVGKAFMPSAKPMIWQNSFHDHIIRNEKDYRRIWQYIDNNPLKWTEDCFYKRNNKTTI